MQVSFDTLDSQNGEESFAGAFTRQIEDGALKFISCHASPICFEKYYREYMITSLPHLKVLDNLPIREDDRERATITFSQYFEYLPYRRKHKESVVSILQRREIRASQSLMRTPKQKSSYISGKSKYFYTRSLCAAKVGSSAWPFLHPLSISSSGLGDEGMGFRPRQFEYHPSDSSLMVFGTLDGEVVVVNHEKEKIVSHILSLGAMNSVLGLCWLKNYPSKVYYSCRECGKESKFLCFIILLVHTLCSLKFFSGQLLLRLYLQTATSSDFRMFCFFLSCLFGAMQGID